MKLKAQLSHLITQALQKASIEAPLVSVNESTKPEFGDYQYNGIMPLAKSLKANPRQIAQTVADTIDCTTLIESVEVAGPGFINIRLRSSACASIALEMVKDSRLGVEGATSPQKIIVDYSGPNMAKEMHVGHLRSTIIGDTLARLAQFLGHEVIRQNHIGDWGTQFGMLIAYLEEQSHDGNVNLKNLEEFYKNAKKRFDESESFANIAREYVVKIQGGDAHCLGLWKRFIEISLGHCEEVYGKLGVTLTKKDVKAESYYNEWLPKVTHELESRGVLVVSEGAKCVFVDGSATPLIIQKSDGGYLYATTDLAALWYRSQELHADRILYVVDARQGEHFKQVFSIAKAAGLVKPQTLLEHIAFGTMMDKGGKPFKTRDGGTVKLIELLDEAVERSQESIRDKETKSERSIQELMRIIGIGAVKYADLSIHRESNYIFDWDKMLSLDGNTSLYMQYGYARIMGILGKFEEPIQMQIEVENESEAKLLMSLIRFEDILENTFVYSTPHTMTGYLYDLTTHFMRFYESSPILKEDIPHATKHSRLTLATLTAKVIKQGLDILGIEVANRI